MEPNAFYETDLGRTVCRKLRKRLKDLWPELYETFHNPTHSTVLGMGYGMPYLQPLLAQRKNAYCEPFAVTENHALPWPKQGENRLLQGKAEQLPFAEDSIDRLIVIHGLECCAEPTALLEEAWRVLVPGGKMVLVVPNRTSIWAVAAHTPFGHGKPYTQTQLEQLLGETEFTVRGVQYALFVPPSQRPFVLRMQDVFRRIGRRFFNPLGGVMLLEVEKQLHSPTGLLRAEGESVKALNRKVVRS